MRIVVRKIIRPINKCRSFLWSRSLIVLVSPIHHWFEYPHKNRNFSRPLLIGTFFMVDGFMWKEIIPVWNSYCQLGLTKLSKYFPIGKWSWKERKNTITQPRFNSCSLMILNNLELSFCNCSADWSSVWLRASLSSISKVTSDFKLISYIEDILPFFSFVFYFYLSWKYYSPPPAITITVNKYVSKILQWRYFW